MVDFLDMQEDEIFDFVVIYNAYHHFLNVDALSKKASNVLKKGGKLVIAHSIGRSSLNSHHKQHANNVSRPIDSPQQEAAIFANLFDVAIAEEDSNHYLLVLTKK